MKAAPLLKSLLAPLGIMLLVLLVYAQGVLASISPALIRYSALFLLIIAMILSVGFKKSRFFFMALVITLNYIYQIIFHGGHGMQPMLFLLLPLNILLFALVGERGINTFWGKASFGFILAQLVAIDCMINTPGARLAGLGGLSPLLIYPYLQYIFSGMCLLILVIMGLIRGNQPWGVFIGLILAVGLGFYYSHSQPLWSLSTIAGALMIIVETVKDMYRLAFRDELTGLYSRRCLNQDQLKLAGTYTIAMLDIDHFKKFNDTYGHDVGDQVLKYVASLMKDTGGGTAYRYGGEEFTMVFNGRSKEQAMPVLEELRGTMHDRPFVLRSKDRPQKKPSDTGARPKSDLKVPVTISIGVADSKKSTKPDEVIVSADKALYRAKKNGRDRICG